MLNVCISHAPRHMFFTTSYFIEGKRYPKAISRGQKLTLEYFSSMTVRRPLAASEVARDGPKSAIYWSSQSMICGFWGDATMHEKRPEKALCRVFQDEFFSALDYLGVDDDKQKVRRCKKHVPAR